MSPNARLSRSSSASFVGAVLLGFFGLVAPSAPAMAQNWVEQGLRLFQGLAPPQPPSHPPSYQPPPRYVPPPPRYAPPPPDYRTRAADELNRAEVRDLQRLLVELGYLEGSVDGIVGAQTRAAIARFQAAEGLPRDARPSDKVLRAARGAAEARFAAAPDGGAATSPAASNDTPSDTPEGAAPAAADGPQPGSWQGSLSCNRERLPLRLDVDTSGRTGRMRAGAGAPFSVSLIPDPHSGTVAILPEPLVARAPGAVVIAMEGRQGSDGALSGSVLGRCEEFALRPLGRDVVRQDGDSSSEANQPEPAAERSARADDGGGTSSAALSRTTAATDLRFVHHGGSRQLEHVPDESNAVSRALLLAWWRTHPELASNPDRMFALAEALLPEDVRNEMIERGRWAGADEFARQRTRTRFRETWLPRLLAEAPALPFRYVEISTLPLGEYEFQATGFRLLEPVSGTRVRRQTSVQGESRVGGHAVALDRDRPRLLPIARSEAEALLERQRILAREREHASNGRYPSPGSREAQPERVVFLRSEIEVVAPTPDPWRGGSHTWTARIARMDLFEDAALQHLLLDDNAIRAADPGTALAARAAQPVTPPVALAFNRRGNWDESVFLLAVRADPTAIGEEAWQHAAAERLRLERREDTPSWGRLFPQGFDADDRGRPMPEHVEAYRAWTLARVAALPGVLWLPDAVPAEVSRRADEQIRLAATRTHDRDDPRSLSRREVEVGTREKLAIRLRLPQQRERYFANAKTADLEAVAPRRRSWLRLRLADVGTDANGPVIEVVPELLVVVPQYAGADAQPRLELAFGLGETEVEQRARLAAEAAAAEQARAATNSARLAILDIRPGMKLDAARRAIEAYLGPDAVAMVPASDPAGQPEEALFDASVMLVRPDGSETIALFASRRDEPATVAAVRRELRFAEGRGPQRDAFFAQLADHYGDPNQDSHLSGTWFGALEAGERPASGSRTKCRDMLREQQGLWRIEGVPRFGAPRYDDAPMVSAERLGSDACGTNLALQLRLDGSEVRKAVMVLGDAGIASRLAGLPAKAPAAPHKLGFSSGFPDILGLRPGMTLAEAEPLVRAHLPDATMLEADASGATLSPQDYRALATGRMFADTARQEALILLTETDGGADRVVAVLRHLAVPAGGPDIAGIVAGLIAKYGEPAQRRERVLRWGNGFALDRSLPTAGSCVMVQTRSAQSDWRMPSGGAATGPLAAFLQALPALRVDPLQPHSSPRRQRRVLDCPAEVGAELRENPAGGVALHVWAIDPGAADEVLSEIRGGDAGTRMSDTTPGVVAAPGRSGSIRF